MNDNTRSSHQGLYAGLGSALPLGIVLGFYTFESLALGFAAALAIGLLSGLVIDWKRS